MDKSTITFLVEIWLVLVNLLLGTRGLLFERSAHDTRLYRESPSRDACLRDAPGTSVGRSAGDGGFRIQALGHAERYSPGQVYTGQSVEFIRFV